MTPSSRNSALSWTPFVRAGLLLFVAMLTLPGCLMGLRLGPIAIGGGVGAAPEQHQAELEAGGIRIDDHRVDIAVRRDTTYRATIETRRTLLTPAGLITGQRAARTYDPRHQSLELEEAYVISPEGARTDVSSKSVFTRPSEAAQSTPGFVKSLTTTVVFPQLRVGSQTFTRWTLVERAPSTLGFNYSYRPDLTLPVTNATVSISYPSDMPLTWRARGDFKLDESSPGTRTQTITATLRDFEGFAPERKMVAPVDVVPVFVASTLSGWEEIGARFHDTVADRVEVTPEIQKLADELTSGREGIEAVRAIYQWLCHNVHYVAVYMNATDSWTPHRASEVLANGFGDCKDKYVLFASLLRARGIEAEPALVLWSNSFERLPLWTPAQFDHCLAYLPAFDVYANPTNPYADLGVLEQSLSGKFVVHGVRGGRVARTPETRSDRHRYVTDHRVRIDADGNVTGEATMEFTGRISAYFRARLATTGRLEDVATDSLLGSPEGGSGDFAFTTDPTDLETPLRCDASWSTEQAIDTRGQTIRFAVPTGVEFASSSRALPFLVGDARRFPVVVATVEGEWTHHIEIPEGYTVSHLPRPRNLDNLCGGYSSEYDVDADGTIRVVRKLRLQKDVVPPEQYPMVRELLRAWVQDSRAVLEATKSATP